MRRAPAASAALGCSVLLLSAWGCGSTGASPCRLDGPKPSAHRGLYVTDATAAATDPDATTRLLSLIDAGHFDTVVPYNLAPLLDEPDGGDRTAALFLQLRSAGVTTIAAPVGSVDRVRQITGLTQRNSEARFDALVTEFEYWNQCRASPSDTNVIRSDCFTEMQELVGAMQSAAVLDPHLRIGAYLGSPTQGEVSWLKGRLDFVFLDYPIRTPTDAGRQRDRLNWCAGAGLEVWPILYTRGEVPMQPWLCSHGLVETEQTFLANLPAVPVRGFQYFADDGFELPERSNPDASP